MSEGVGKKEFWFDIPGFPEYKITKCGRIKGSRYAKELTPFIGLHGYYCVRLYKNHKAKNFRLHRLLAEVFIKNPFNKPFVDHIDGDKLNNNLINLRWALPKENSDNSKRLDRILKGSAHHKAKLREKDIIYIRNNFKRFGSKKSNIRDLAEKFNVTPDAIGAVVNGRSWKHVSYEAY